MPTPSPEQTTLAFVIRLWAEDDPSGRRVWRGYARHVQSGRQAYFQGLERLPALLEALANPPQRQGTRRTKG